MVLGMGRIVGWGLFGAAVRWWTIGLQMRNHFSKGALSGYPPYIAIGAAVGYWLDGVEERQLKYIKDKRDLLLEKRERVAARAEGREPRPIPKDDGPVPANVSLPSP